MTSRSLTLETLPGLYAVCRLDAAAELPPWALVPAKARPGGLVSITRSEAELSVVCPQSQVPSSARAERDWRCLRVIGPLGFGMTGILASLASPLASTGVSIFVVSTYDTDYLLVQQRDENRARHALERAGHRLAG